MYVDCSLIQTKWVNKTSKFKLNMKTVHKYQLLCNCIFTDSNNYNDKKEKNGAKKDECLKKDQGLKNV